jgi:hypothetical protein
MPATIHHVGVAAAMEKCAVCAVVLYSFSSRLWLGNPLRTRWAEKVVFDFACFFYQEDGTPAQTAHLPI